MPKKIHFLFFGVLLALSLNTQLYSQQQAGSGVSIEGRLQKRMRELYAGVPKARGLNLFLAQSQGPRMVARLVGDVAKGVIVDEVSDELYLDANPCAEVILTFKKPYTKEKVGTIQCGDKTFDTYQVRKVGASSNLEPSFLLSR